MQLLARGPQAAQVPSIGTLSIPVLREPGWLYDWRGLSLTPRLRAQVEKLVRAVLERRRLPDGYVLIVAFGKDEAPADLVSASDAAGIALGDDDYELDVRLAVTLFPLPLGVVVKPAHLAREARVVFAIPAPMHGYSDGDLESVERRLGLR